MSRLALLNASAVSFYTQGICMIYNEKLYEDFFEFFLFLANSKIEKMEDEALVSLLFQYERNMAQLSKLYPVIADNRYTQIMAGIASDEDMLADRRQGLLKVKRHVVGLLDGIMGPSDKALIKMSGKQEITINNDNHFAFYFTPTKFNADEFIWNDENSLFDMIFIDLIRVQELDPARFQRCARCKNYFYQPTAMEKIYCSTRCSNSARQAKHYQQERTKRMREQHKKMFSRKTSKKRTG